MAVKRPRHIQIPGRAPKGDTYAARPNGKTLMAKALATESEVNFISIKALNCSPNGSARARGA